MILEKYDLLIIGAGICGLTIGQALTKSSCNYKIVEKSRAYGGRAATRRIHGQNVDHGAQYFTVQDPRFASWIEELEERKIVQAWTKKLSVWNGDSLSEENISKTRYVCQNGMTAMAKDLATVLPVSRELKITSLSSEGKLWRLKTDQDLEILAEKVVSTAPLPQTMELFANHLTNDIQEELKEIKYNPCLCAIFIYENTQSIDWKGIFWNNGNIVSWVSYDSSKRVNPNQTIIVVHCTPEFSAQNFEENEEIVFSNILQELSNALPEWINSPKEKQLKKWRYSQAAKTIGKPFLKSHDGTLILTGDWCLESKIEGAYLAGLEVAASILS